MLHSTQFGFFPRLLFLHLHLISFEGDRFFFSCVLMMKFLLFIKSNCISILNGGIELKKLLVTNMIFNMTMTSTQLSVNLNYSLFQWNFCVSTIKSNPCMFHFLVNRQSYIVVRCFMFYGTYKNSMQSFLFFTVELFHSLTLSSLSPSSST